MERQDTVLLVGAGAVERAWEPVIQALRKLGYEDLVSEEAANFALARLVYIARLCLAEHADQSLKEQQSACLDVLVKAQDLIAKHIEIAARSGAINVRPEFDVIMNRFVLSCSRRIALVTTNWDTCVAAALAKLHRELRVDYLHGGGGEDGQLYLPTEVVEEPYRQRNDRVRLNNRRAEAVGAITHATRVVIYGLGLSPLDVELGQVLSSGIHESTVREIIVINPDYVRVAERVATLNDAGGPNRPIYGIHPNRLDQRWRFLANDARAEQERLSQWSAEPA